MLGKTVKVIVDRPKGSRHLNFENLIYEVNYGYIQGIYGGDGEEQDAYILGVDKPVSEFSGKVIAIIHREDDVEEKWVVCSEDMHFTKDEIIRQTNFQEKYFSIKIIMED